MRLRVLAAPQRRARSLWERFRARSAGAGLVSLGGTAWLQAVDEHAWHRFDRLTFVSRRPATGGLGGEHRSTSRAPSIDFVDYRAYYPGDDLRRVDWNVYGRLGTLQIKVTEARERLDIVLVLDCSASMRWGEPDKFAYAAQATAALAYVGLQRADVVRIVCLGQQPHAYGPSSGRAHFPDVIRFLDRVVPDGRLGLDEQLPGVLNSVLPRGRRGQPLVVLISDLLVDEPARLGQGFDTVLRDGADLVVLHVLSPREEAPDPEGEVELVDAETGDTLEVGMSVEVIARYRRRLDAWLGAVESVCAARGARYVRVRTDRPLESLMLNDLRRAEVVR